MHNKNRMTYNHLSEIVNSWKLHGPGYQSQLRNIAKFVDVDETSFSIPGHSCSQ